MSRWFSLFMNFLINSDSWFVASGSGGSCAVCAIRTVRGGWLCDLILRLTAYSTPSEPHRCSKRRPSGTAQSKHQIWRDPGPALEEKEAGKRKSNFCFTQEAPLTGAGWLQMRFLKYTERPLGEIFTALKQGHRWPSAARTAQKGRNKSL